MKKLITILCTFMIALSITSFGPVKRVEAETCPFTDITTNDKQLLKDAVTFLYCNGIAAGKPGNVFGKNDLVTRAEFVTFLYKMAGTPSVITTNPFNDVKESDYFYKAVLWAVANGVTSGTTATTFSPNNNVTYQEIFTFIHAFSTKVVGRENANKTTYSLTYPKNLSKYSDWAKTHVTWAYRNGIVYGVKDNDQFSPKGKATRGDVAMFLYNYYRSFQNRYALLAGNTGLGGTWLSSRRNINDMSECLSENMTMTRIVAYNTVPDRNTFASYMLGMFSSAACIDECYIYLTCHGSTSGLSLFSSETDAVLTPNYLAILIGRYKGHFSVIIDSCYSGVFVDYFAAISEKNVVIMTSADSTHEAMNYNTPNNYGGVATRRWVSYITNEMQRREFVSLREVWYFTKDYINRINTQNPSFYAYKTTYVSFTKAFNLPSEP